MSSRRRIRRITTGSPERHSGWSDRSDDLTAEAPLNLVVDDTVIATLMRTPGHDLELSAGWLAVESGVRRGGDLIGLRQCRTTDGARTVDGSIAAADVEWTGRGIDQVHLSLAPGVRPPRPRSWVTGAACGVCSADVLDLTPLRWAPAQTPGWTVRVGVLLDLPDRMRRMQRTFSRTGSLHAAALATRHGDLLVVREDVGRHNAVDKTTGWALLNDRLPATDLLLVVSGRVSFEIVQKAVASSVAGIVAVSAPSDLAVDLAREHGVFLAGMLRGHAMNCYSGADRLID
jgi:FdhD protein